MSATSKGTAEYFKAHGAITPVAFGRTGLLVSPVGFGGYRVHDQEPKHAEALRLALTSGCNLIDTSANYTDGGSERLIGGILGELEGEGKLSRDQVVIVSKAGYVQGRNMSLARARAADGDPFPEMVEYSPECWHNISPGFLADQLTRTLDRLGIEKLDVLLLHNPEYFLKTRADHAEYYRRIRRAFEHLERECDRGRIGWYGISSNSFPDAKESEEFTSLEAVLEAAREVSRDHRFAVIQFPLNLFEAGAALEHNNAGQTVAGLAREAGLAALVNRPLNAFAADRMIRLADFPAHTGESVSEAFRAALTRAAELETRYPGKDVVPAARIAWAHIIKQNFGRVAQLLRWRELLEYQIGPERDGALEALEAAGFGDWAREYRSVSDRLFAAFTAYLESEAAIQSKDLGARLASAAPALASSQTLSQKAIRLCRSVPGVTSVLVGMRSPEYVRDALTLEPPLADGDAVAAFRSVSS